MLNRTLTEEQIRDMWNNRAWQGKSTGDPFIVRGGYRCRHTWIPTDPAWGEETVDELPTEEELPPPPQPRVTVSDVPIGFLLNQGSEKTRKAFDDDFNSQLTDQQKIIVAKFDKPKTIRNRKDGHYYAPDKSLVAELDAKHDGGIKSFVIAHEYGHHIDYIASGRNMAWSETSKEFRKAINDDRKRFKGRNYGTKYVIDNKEVDKLYNKLGSLETIEKYSTKNPERLIGKYQTTIVKEDGFAEISDIVDALVYGKFQRKYTTYGHGVSYYNRFGAEQKEIFANLFAIKHNKKAYAMAKTIIPNTVKEFEKRLNELEKQ